MPTKPMDQRDPWALAFRKGMLSWLEDQGIDGADLARRLRMDLGKWRHAIRATIITDTELYARIFYFTGVLEADPRALPANALGKRRSMTEEEWEEWVADNGYLYVYGTEYPEDTELSLEDEKPIVEEPIVEDEERVLLAAIALLEKPLNKNEEAVQAFLARNGRLLGKLLKKLQLYMLDENAREIARKLNWR